LKLGHKNRTFYESRCTLWWNAEGIGLSETSFPDAMIRLIVYLSSTLLELISGMLKYYIINFLKIA